MAMRGKFKRKSKVATEIPDCSLADMAFLLLIFFMTTTTFRREQAREIEQPEAIATEKVDEKRQNILHLWIERNGDVYINDAEIPIANISDVVGPLFVESDERLVVAIRSDRQVPYVVINGVTEELRQAGALRVNFATHFEQRVRPAQP